MGRFFDLTTLKPIYRAIKVENGTGPGICVPGLRKNNSSKNKINEFLGMCLRQLWLKLTENRKAYSTGRIIQPPFLPSFS